MVHMIDRVLLHPLQYPEMGQNYVFNGCMSFLMECIGEDKQFDYWFFSIVTGDCFVQVFNTNKAKWSTCYSQSAFDCRLIRRVFDAVGYDFVYLGPEEWKSDRAAVRAKIVRFIDRGVPVIAKGFHSIIEGTELPTDEISCVVGYEDDGRRFLRMTEEGTDTVSFTLEDDLPYTFVFIGDKKEAPPLAKVYRYALINAPKLMQTPHDNDVYFGRDAFEQWAKSLESGFYHMDRAEYQAAGNIAGWRYYCVYVCMIATNIFSKKYAMDKALRMNTDLAPLTFRIDKEYAELDRMEKELQSLGGFHVTYEILQDADKCRELACLIRQISSVWDRIRAILEEIK